MPEKTQHICHHGEISDCHRSWQKRLKSQDKNNKLLLKSDLEATTHQCHLSNVSSSSSRSTYSHYSQNVSHFLVLVLTLLTFAHCAGKTNSKNFPKIQIPSIYSRIFFRFSRIFSDFLELF